MLARPMLLIAYCAMASGYVHGVAPLVPQRAGTGARMVAERLPRRQALFAAFSALALVAPHPAVAEGGKIWVSGKSDPLRPTSKDKTDGTKKDNKYLSCLNDCVPRKQGFGAAQKDRADCLDQCQQECCFTYEQCTYSIRK